MGRPVDTREAAGSGARRARQDAEQQLRVLAAAAGVPVKGIYRPGEVCAMLRISRSTLAALCDCDQHPAVTVQDPQRLTCYRLTRHRRIPHEALVDWLARNIAYERE